MYTLLQRTIDEQLGSLSNVAPNVIVDSKMGLTDLFGLLYKRPYLVLDLNLISNLHVTQQITLVNWWITLVNKWITLVNWWFTLLNWWFTLVKYLISGLQVLLS